MPQNFLPCDREQVLLMPPSLAEWLPEDHFAWFVLAAVEEMNLAAFCVAYRQDGPGRAAHDPAMTVALLLYAYARGERSSRAIERACVEDIAHRAIAANRVPDHSTIARFRQRHEAALAGLFSDVLSLCADAGLAGVAVIAVDGTKVHLASLRVIEKLGIGASVAAPTACRCGPSTPPFDRHRLGRPRTHRQPRRLDAHGSDEQRTRSTPTPQGADSG